MPHGRAGLIKTIQQVNMSLKSSKNIITDGSLLITMGPMTDPMTVPLYYTHNDIIQCTPLNEAMFKKATLGYAIQSRWNGFFYISLCTKYS